MKLTYRVYILLYPLYRLVTKGLRYERRPYQREIPGLKPAPRPWYLALIRETLKTMLLLIAGIAVGIVGVVLAHYSGFENFMLPEQYK